jgi:hypothetical protein
VAAAHLAADGVLDELLVLELELVEPLDVVHGLDLGLWLAQQAVGMVPAHTFRE